MRGCGRLVSRSIEGSALPLLGTARHPCVFKHLLGSFRAPVLARKILPAEPLIVYH